MTTTSPTSALLLIDVQESFRHRPYWRAVGAEPFLSNTNKLIQACVNRGIPIVRVFHTDGENVASNPFAQASGHIKPLLGLVSFTAAIEIQKQRHSALVGTGLSIWLHQNGIEKLLIAGIRTEQCCETTARHASDEGWQVDYITEATLTFDMKTLNGETLSTAQIMERTEAVLKDRFAQIKTVDQVIREL